MYFLIEIDIVLFLFILFPDIFQKDFDVQHVFSLRKKVTFSLITFVLLFGFINGIAWLCSRDTSVFWQNPLMMMYPVDSFDERALLERYNFNKNPNRPVKYTPDSHRWYRLTPEPLIPEQGNLILNFGDSSTWGWGLSDRGAAYPFLLNTEHIHSANLGVPGYSSLQGLRYMEELLPKHHRRIRAVTLYFGNNDSVENGSSDASKLTRETKPLIRTVRWFPVGRIVHDSVAKLHQENNKEPRVNPADYEMNLRRMISLTHGYGIPVVVIEPLRHLSWRPAHLTYSRSLEQKVQNKWVKGELAIAGVAYLEGLGCIYRAEDAYETHLIQALNHDWVIPRIKTAWLEKLRKISREGDVTYVRLPEPWILAEHGSFEDWCHPSAYMHRRLAERIAQVLNTR